MRLELTDIARLVTSQSIGNTGIDCMRPRSYQLIHFLGPADEIERTPTERKRPPIAPVALFVHVVLVATQSPIESAVHEITSKPTNARTRDSGCTAASPGPELLSLSPDSHRGRTPGIPIFPYQPRIRHIRLGLVGREDDPVRSDHLVRDERDQACNPASASPGHECLILSLTITTCERAVLSLPLVWFHL